MTRFGPTLWRKFWRGTHGAAAAEFALVVMIFVVFVFAIIDFGRAFWDWNRAAKATQEGVRFAIVNDMVPASLQNFDGLGLGGAGAKVGLTDISPNPVVCGSSGCSGYGYNGTAYQAIVDRMALFFPRVSEAGVEVVVEYEHVGLGFIGNPFGSDITPAVTIKLQGLNFAFLTPGLTGLNSLSMPEFATTATGEDFQN